MDPVDFFAGSVSGCLGQIFGHPCDTIKVRMQTSPEVYKNFLHCFRLIWSREGPLAFFQGVAAPVSAAAPINALIFGGYETVARTAKKHWPEASKDSKLLTFVAGACGGIAQTVVLVPLDLLKCRLQVDGQSSVRKYKGTFDCFRQTLRHEGVRGLFTGFGTSFWREVPSFGLYFLTYDMWKNSLLSYFECTPDSPGGLLTFIVAGGFAGMVSWGSCYPFDVIKSMVQTLPRDAPPVDRTTLGAFRRIMREHGPRHFVHGLGPCLVRAFSVNMVLFPTYELISRALQ